MVALLPFILIVIASLTVNTVDATSGEQLTQFGRALKTLDIEHIKANSPQANGRVERANKTLQDRLLKKMRLEGISSIEESNAFLATYMEKHNQKFAVSPASDEDANRPVMHSKEELDLIFSKHHKRKLSKNLSLQYTTFKRGEKVPEPVSEKAINQAVDQALTKQTQRINYKPKIDHPWRKSFNQKRTLLLCVDKKTQTLLILA